MPTNTTTDMVDTLLGEEACKVAPREGVTVRALIGRDSHLVMSETKSAASFTLRRCSFRGDGLLTEFQTPPWDRLRETIYWDRGE